MCLLRSLLEGSNGQPARRPCTAQLSRSGNEEEEKKKIYTRVSPIGVGKLHVHAPHLFLGYAMPPCPTCGWKSVDNDTIKTKGVCPARRVYAAEIDKYVSGQNMLCTVCKQGAPCTLFTPNGAPCGLISRICFLSFAGANAGACLRMIKRPHLSTLHLGFAH